MDKEFITKEIQEYIELLDIDYEDMNDAELKFFDDFNDKIYELLDLVKLMQSQRHYYHAMDWYYDTDDRDREKFQDDLNEIIDSINDLMGTRIKDMDIIPSKSDSDYVDSSIIQDVYYDDMNEIEDNIIEKYLDKYDAEDEDDLDSDIYDKMEKDIEDKRADFLDTAITKEYKKLSNLKEDFNSSIERYLLSNLEVLLQNLTNNENVKVVPTGYLRARRSA